MEDARAIRERSEGFYAKVYACLLPGGGEGLYWHISARETDIPAIRFFADGNRLGRAFQRARPAHGNAPDLGENEETIVQRRPVAKLLVGERMPAVAPLIAGKSRLLARLHPEKERLIRLVQPRQHVLQHMAVEGGVLWHGGAEVLQLRFLAVA